MMYRTLQQKRATAAWWVLGAILLAGLVWTVPAQGITVDGKISPYDEWDDANVIIKDLNEAGVPDDYDVKRIMMEDGDNSLYVSITVYSNKIALTPGNYLNFYFNLSTGGGPVYRFGLTYNDGYGFDSGEMHVVQYDYSGWNDLGEPEFAYDEAVEVRIPWDMLPEELIGGGKPIQIQSPFFLYNVAPGDLNNDGAVDWTDYTTLRVNYGGPGGWTEGDINLDGRVGWDDFCLIRGHYGYNAPDGSSHDMFDDDTLVIRNNPLTKHTPEPLTILAVGMSIAGLAGYIRRRNVHQGRKMA